MLVALYTTISLSPSLPPSVGPQIALDALWDDESMKLPRVSEWPVGEADVPILRSTLTHEQEATICRFLSFDNPEYFKALNSGQAVDGIPRYLRAYEKTRSLYRLPRHAPFRKFGIREPRFVIPKTEMLPWEFTKTLRENQHAPFEALKHQLIYRKDGVLVLSCGRGKTIIATAAFAWQQRPTLAIVTQLFIAQQWKDALLTFTNIPEDRIGLIGDGKNEWNKDFVISTVQSLAKRDDLPPDFYRRFGIIFFDEVHRLGAPLFSRVVPVFTGVRIGLTATLERTDGMHKLFMLHVGEKFYEDRSQQLIPRVYFLPTPVQKDVSGFRQWGGHRKLNMAKIVTHLSRLDYRREFVLGLIQRAFKKNRKVLLLSERKDELFAYREILGDDSGLCIGSMSQDERQQSLQKPIILATAQLVKEGLDKADIDTLVIEFPQSSEAFSEQAAGRILRMDDSKRSPKIYVLVDSGVYVGKENRYYPFTVKAKKMAQTFRKLNYEIIRGMETYGTSTHV